MALSSLCSGPFDGYGRCLRKNGMQFILVSLFVGNYRVLVYGAYSGANEKAFDICFAVSLGSDIYSFSSSVPFTFSFSTNASLSFTTILTR